MENTQNTNLNIGYNTDSVFISEALSSYTFIKEGYIYPIDDLLFKTTEFYKFLDILKEDYELKKYDFSDNKKSLFVQYNCDEFILFISGDSKEVYLSVQSKTLDISLKIHDLYKKFYVEDTEVKIYMTSYYIDRGTVQDITKTLDKNEIRTISDSYYPYINNDIMYQQFFSLQENILILAGKPGIGKSKMASSILKYAADHPEIIPYDKLKNNNLLESQFINVCYVKSLDVLSSDVFWRELGEKEFDFVILDDLDYFLTARNNEVTSTDEDNKNKFLNQFLSYTDGIEKHKTKFIITTNQPFTDIDIALLRKGRLFDILELRDLSRAEGLNIWEESGLAEYDFLLLYGKHDRILPADLGSEISKRTNDKITNALEAYCSEDGISRIKQAQQIKKAGF